MIRLCVPPHVCQPKLDTVLSNLTAPGVFNGKGMNKEALELPEYWMEVIRNSKHNKSWAVVRWGRCGGGDADAEGRQELGGYNSGAGVTEGLQCV